MVRSRPALSRALPQWLSVQAELRLQRAKRFEEQQQALQAMEERRCAVIYSRMLSL